MLQYFWPSDDEQIAGQAIDSHFAEDAEWWVGVQQCGAALALVIASALVSTSTACATSVFSQFQDDPAGNLAFAEAVTEEYWQNPVPPVNWPQTSVFTDDDVHPTFVQTFTPDDGDWKPLVSPVADTNYVRLPFLDPEDFPQFPAATNPVDDSAIWAPNSPPWEPTWTLLFFLDDGSSVPVFQYDEDFWQQPVVPPVNWPQPAQPFSSSDEDNLIAEFVAAEDPIWLQLTPPVSASLVWPQPFTFEQNDSPTLTSFTDEVYSPVLVQPVPDSIWLLRQDAFDTQDPAGSLTLVLDDAFFSLNIPGVPLPDPGSLALLQQWPFEQNEPAGSLRNTVDEDFWINPVPPVNWPQPKVFVFDEQIVPQSTAVVDEDFWSGFGQPFVPPVPQSFYIDLPYGAGFGLLTDPEEIPAGSLFTPIPPPVVPCTPPAGFDKDTTVTYFGGKNPTQALFCRVCQSGKPLLVRGDYAIWCQDCCSFVSKADTVMGTVRAPGAFRGRF